MIAWGRLGYGGAALGIAIVSGVFGGHWLKNNANALSNMLSFFSILAGFLVAVMALTADDRGLRGSNWRAKHYNAKTIKKRLERHRALLLVYLAACSLAFINSLGIRAGETFERWFNGVTLAVAVFAFLLSFSLPFNLSSEHLRRLERAIVDAKDPPDDRGGAGAG